MNMKKYTIPSILAVTVLMAGIFAFMPVEQASTVHTTGTTVAVIGAGGIGVGDFATASVTADAIATNAIGSDELAATAVTELQTFQVLAFGDENILAAALSCSATGASFLVHYVISDIAEGETVTISGTGVASTLTITGDVAANLSGPNWISGTISGTTGQTITFASSATTADVHVTIETATGATAVACA